MTERSSAPTARSPALAVLLLLAYLGSAAAQPRLAVVIVVDQMRAAILTEFADDFEGGFARLVREGALFADAYHDHALTETAPGHATIATGTHPSRHGVVANQIWSYEDDTLRNIVLDDAVTVVGAERRSGRSPHRLMRSAVGDWLKAQSPASRVFAVSLKDRSAVFAAGQHPDGVFWYDERAGNFVTSSYYYRELPAWVSQFNDEDRVDAYFGDTWSPALGAGHDRRSHGLEDGASFSGFPHALVGDSDEPDRRFFARFRRTPFADRLTLDLAESLIESEQLGSDDAPDLLLIGLSAADYIGHRYGPWSEETHDHYVRLDGYLGAFLAYLDRRLGRDRYVLVLTADHGVMPIPEQMESLGYAAGRTVADELLAEVQPLVLQSVERGVVPAMPVLGYASGVVFDFDEADVSDSELDALADVVADDLRARHFVAGAYTAAELGGNGPGDDAWLGRYRRSFYSGRSPAVMVRAVENHLISSEESGASHGSPYAYDTHIPLIFVGAGIAPGEHEDSVRSVDIAPTLAALLRVEVPADLDGRDVSARLHATR